MNKKAFDLSEVQLDPHNKKINRYTSWSNRPPSFAKGVLKDYSKDREVLYSLNPGKEKGLQQGTVKDVSKQLSKNKTNKGIISVPVNLKDATDKELQLALKGYTKSRKFLLGDTSPYKEKVDGKTREELIAMAKTAEFISKQSTAEFLQKQAAMIDPVQDRMVPEIWNPDETLRKDVRDKILTLLYDAVPEDRIKNVILMGATTSYQYNPKSDLDINVSIEGATEAEEGSSSSSLVADISHIPIHEGGSRTMQYYVRKARPRELDSFENNPTAVYDVLSDRWITRPRKPKELRDPEDKFALDYIIAKGYKRDFIRKVDKYEALKTTYKKTKDKIVRKQAEQALREVLNLVTQVYHKRRDGYSFDWGVGRNSWRNVIFKVLEYSPRAEYFQKFLNLSGEVPKDSNNNIKLI